MVSDLLFLFGALLLIVAMFLVSVILGLAVMGVVVIAVAVALSDGKGISWRP